MSIFIVQFVVVGVSIWFDDFLCICIFLGNFVELILLCNVVGVIMNLMIFVNVIMDKNNILYDVQVFEFVVFGVFVEEVVFVVMMQDVCVVFDVFCLVWEELGYVDGCVLIEVFFDFVYDIVGMVVQVKELWSMIDCFNFLVKILVIKVGLLVIMEVIVNGISVNVMLIFSLECYVDVIDVYLIGFECVYSGDFDLLSIYFVVLFFVFCVDIEIDKWLLVIGILEVDVFKSKVGFVNVCLVYEFFEQKFVEKCVQDFIVFGVNFQCLLWVLMGVKDLVFFDILYVIELVVQGVVNMMLEKMFEVIFDYGVVIGDMIMGGYDEVCEVFVGFMEFGIDFDDVIQVFEEEGVVKFIDLWYDLFVQVVEVLEVQ